MATYSVSLDKELNSGATTKATELGISVEDYIRGLIRKDTEIGGKEEDGS